MQSSTVPPRGARARRLPRPATVAAILITLYAGLLRVEALIANYGWIGQPAWSAALERYASPVARRLRPASIVWGPVPHPYVNGDPINYIRFAREMRHFYQAHVREPVFLALTRGYLWLSGGRDIAVSYASATGSTLAVFATYLVGAAAFSPIVGLAAALALAIEVQAIAWSIEGWRDDTFMFFVALSAWAMLRLRAQPTALRATIGGVVAAGACLTRITAVSFVVPGLLWLIIDSPPDRRSLVARRAGLAALFTAAIVAPYLISCAMATGDPFLAINYHTRYYRAAEGVPFDEPQGALTYVGLKLRTHPWASIDTAYEGLVTWPFFNKWRGFEWWSRYMGSVLEWSAAAGIAAALWSANGRLILVLIVTSLVPYAMTWSVGGGGEWRFTQHVYPFYLVLAFWAIVSAVRWAIAAASRHSVGHPPVSLPTLIRVAAVLVAAALGWAAYYGLPLLTVREALSRGEPVTIAAGARDRYFFQGHWSPPIESGVVVRVAESDRVAMRLPTPTGSDYLLSIRVDPAETTDPTEQPRLTAFLNGRTIAQIRMTRDPERMGTYRVRVSKDAVTNLSRLDFVASHTVPARDAGPRFAKIPGQTPVAFRLWYVRLERDLSEPR